MSNRWYYVAVVLPASTVTYVNKGATTRNAALMGAWRRYPTARRIECFLLPTSVTS